MLSNFRYLTLILYIPVLLIWSCIAFSCHFSLVSFNLEEFLSLPLSFMQYRSFVFYRKFFSLGLPRDLIQVIYLSSVRLPRKWCVSLRISHLYIHIVHLLLVSDFKFGQGVTWFIHYIVITFSLATNKQSTRRYPSVLLFLDEKLSTVIIYLTFV